MGRFLGGVVVGMAVSATALGQLATFTPLRGDKWPFPVVGGNWRTAAELPPLSGDGSTVTDGRWRWTRNGGVVPVGFVPGFNQSSEIVRSPLDLSHDGSIEFGRLVSVPDRRWAGFYWEGGGRFDFLPNASAIVPSWSASIPRSCLSDDGEWLVVMQLIDPFTLRAFRRSRSGQVEMYPFLLSNFVWSPSVNAASVLNGFGVVRVGAGQSAGEAVMQAIPVFDDYPAQSFAMSSDGRFVLMFQYGIDADTSRIDTFGVVWDTTSGETDRFVPPHGFRSFFGDLEPSSCLSDSGHLAVGQAWNRPQGIASSRPFVRRKGEQARELRVVLDRFGDTNSSYYVIERIGGMSRDGKTILVFYSSPWYGDGAAIVTLPDWEPCPSDLNFDGFVDDADFSIFAKAYDRLTTTDGDMNVDRFTDDADFSIFAAAYDRLVCD